MEIPSVLAINCILSVCLHLSVCLSVTQYSRCLRVCLRLSILLLVVYPTGIVVSSVTVSLRICGPGEQARGIAPADIGMTPEQRFLCDIVAMYYRHLYLHSTILYETCNP